MAPAQRETKKKLTARSERVKGVDVHPSEPLLIASLYSGQVHIWDLENNTQLKSVEVVDLPVRCVKFIARQGWFICGADDMNCRVYNSQTVEKVKQFEAHQDYIRGLAVHPSQPYVLTSSDDMTIKMWDWSKAWENKMIFEDHVHYVMSIVFNPKDHSTFASASLDQTVKVWNVTSPTPNFTLMGHEKGVNSVDFYPGGDKPYLVSGSDDRTVIVWDYQTKQCLQTLRDHSHNVVAVMFHPSLPLIVSGAEDESVKLWNLGTYRLEETVTLGLERVWCLGAQPGSSRLVVGNDKGTSVLKLGKDSFCSSMDQNGKIILGDKGEVHQLTIKSAVGSGTVDGEALTLPTKELAAPDRTPTRISHNSNGQFVAVVSDSEYNIYTALAWRSKTYGRCSSFCWGVESGTFAVYEEGNVTVFKNFKEKLSFRPDGGVKNLYGGALIGIVQEGGSVQFWDWEPATMVRRIEATGKSISWNETGELCALATPESVYILRFDREATNLGIANQTGDEDGIEEAFIMEEEVEERVRQGCWIGDCYLYNTRNNRLKYFIGEESYSLAVLEKAFTLLGYVPRENRIFLCDKDKTVVSYELHLSVIEFQTAIVRGDVDGAMELLLEKVPQAHREKVASFLDAQGHKDLALEVSTDPEHRFELALELDRLDVAQQIAAEAQEASKWKRLGDAALKSNDMELAAHGLKEGDDMAGLCLVYKVMGDTDKLKQLADEAFSKQRYHYAFDAYFMVGDKMGCYNCLCESDRRPEAAIFARSYLPNLMPEAVTNWKKQLSAKVESAIASPEEYPNLFPTWTPPAADAEEPEAEAAKAAEPAEADEAEEVAGEEEAPERSEAQPEPEPTPETPEEPEPEPEAAQAEPEDEVEEDGEVEAEAEPEAEAEAEAEAEEEAAAEPEGNAAGEAAAEDVDDDGWGDDGEEDF